MNVSCTGCRTVFRVDPDKVPSAGVRARCSVCSAVFWVHREGKSAAPTPVVGPVAKAPPPPPPPPPAAPLPPPPAAPPWPGERVPEYLPAARSGEARIGAAVGVGPATPPAPAALPGSAVSARPAPVARPTNPFLALDPAARARRLARALVSDLVVYNPARRRDGLRDGSLKTLFEEEIRKSWDEYVDQVGRELAESTPYFTEALNEILADGQRIF